MVSAARSGHGEVVANVLFTGEKAVMLGRRRHGKQYRAKIIRVLKKDGTRVD